MGLFGAAAGMLWRFFISGAWDGSKPLAFRRRLQYIIGMDYRRSAHSVYKLEYHIVFCTKYRYRILTGQVANRCRDLIREICATHRHISGNVSPDHIHMLISVPPYMSISKVVQYIKGKSSRKLQQEYGELRKKYWGQHMWSRGYFAVTAGSLSTEDVQRYIEEQESHHKADNFKISEF